MEFISIYEATFLHCHLVLSKNDHNFSIGLAHVHIEGFVV